MTDHDDYEGLASASTNRPNVIFILSDDQGIWAAGCYGNPEIRTPNIDRLAAAGVRFQNFFASTPVCSPSRATFLTGRIASQNGVHDWIRGPEVGSNAPPYLDDEICYTDVLAEAGWACGISGKWHLGASQLSQHGFSHWFVHQFGGGPYNDAPMVRNGQLVNEPGYVTNVITADALAFIEQQSATPDPFYLSVHYTAPHSPWTGHPQEIVDSYESCEFNSCPQEPLHPWALDYTTPFLGNREMLKGYFAAVTAMDMDVGRVLQKLEELDIVQTTLVIFASDNGFSCGHHGFWGKGNGTSPINMLENSIKVPFIMSQPGRIPQGKVEESLVSNYDFMPTLLDYLGLKTPHGRNLPGRSFLQTLLGSAPSGRQHVVVYDEYGATRMVRDTRWKYVHRYPDGPNELYDLESDPDERTNLVEGEEHSDRIVEMLGVLEGWFAMYVESEKDGLKHGITGAGQLAPIKGSGDARSEVFARDTYSAALGRWEGEEEKEGYEFA